MPRFRGELALLGGAREGGGTEIGPAPGSGPSERGPSDPSRGGHGRSTSIADQLDAEIPF